MFFFFFQAEDGIRDLTVTGVQTCALPIFHKKYSLCRCSFLVRKFPGFWSRSGKASQRGSADSGGRDYSKACRERERVQDRACQLHVSPDCSSSELECK